MQQLDQSKRRKCYWFVLFGGVIEGAKKKTWVLLVIWFVLECPAVKSFGRVGLLGFSLWCFRCTFVLTLENTSVTIVSLKKFE